jgi:hypothetical protein
MTDKLFDDYVRNKLESYSSSIPSGLWEKIIDEKEKKPKIFWWQPNIGWYAAIGILMLIGSGSYFILHNQKEKNFAVNSTSQNTGSASKSNTLSSASPENKNNNANTFVTHDSIQQSTESVTTNNQTESTAPTVSGSSSNYVTNNTDFGFSKNKKFISMLQSRSKNNLAAIEAKQEEGSLVNEAFNLSIRRNVDNQFFSFTNANLYNKNTIHQPPLNLRNILGLGNNCPSASGSIRNDVYVETYLSPDYSTKTIYPNGTNNSYIQKKDSAEHMRVGFSAGVRLSKSIGDHVMVKAGIQYSQMNEKFAQSAENERQTTTVIVSRTIVRPQGDTTINDTTSVTQIGYRITKSHNHYRNIDIPLSIGYEFSEPKSKWKIGLNGGVILNVASWFQGVTIDTSYNIISANSKGSSGFYNTKVGLSLFGSMSVIRNINPTLDVFAEPYFRYGLYNTNSAAGFSQKFNTLGVQLGVRMKINGRQHL